MTDSTIAVGTRLWLRTAMNVAVPVTARTARGARRRASRGTTAARATAIVSSDCRGALDTVSARLPPTSTAGATSHVQAGIQPSQAQPREPDRPGASLMSLTLPIAAPGRIVRADDPAVLNWGDKAPVPAQRG